MKLLFLSLLSVASAFRLPISPSMAKPAAAIGGAVGGVIALALLAFLFVQRSTGQQHTEPRAADNPTYETAAGMQSGGPGGSPAAVDRGPILANPAFAAPPPSAAAASVVYGEFGNAAAAGGVQDAYSVLEDVPAGQPARRSFATVSAAVG